MKKISSQPADELRPEYDHDDDFLEMVTQFGYVTFFAAAFPLAAPIALLLNFFEVRSDAFKLLFVHRRTTPFRADDIGPWLGILRVFAFFSVVSNALLFTFTSNQMRLIFPDLFDPDGTVQLGDGRYVVAVAFGLEHALLLLCALLQWRIPNG